MIDQNTEFHNQSTKLWLQDNSIEIYETHNEAKSIAAEECLETLKKQNLQLCDRSVKKCLYQSE